MDQRIQIGSKHNYKHFKTIKIMIKIEQPILSRVVGNTFAPNGQELLSKLKTGDQILWEREPGNKFDKNAIQLFNSSKNKIGYIPKDLAKDLAEMIDNGKIKAMEIKVNQITGSEEKNLGCNVIIVCYDKTDLL